MKSEHRLALLVIYLVSGIAFKIETTQAEDAAEPGKKTIALLDFSKPENCNIRDAGTGEFIDSPDGKGRCLSIPVKYMLQQGGVPVFCDIRLPAGKSYAVGPYMWLDLEIYYEGPQDPGLWLDACGTVGKRFPRSSMHINDLKPGVWQTRTVNISPLAFEASPFEQPNLPRMGDSFRDISVYADDQGNRWIKKLYVRNLHFYEEDKLADSQDVNAKDPKGESRLHLAAYSGRIEKVQELIAKGATIDIRNNDQETPLHHATCAGFPKIVELLLEHKAQIDAENSHKQTPIHYAAAYNQVGAGKVLIAHGANVKAGVGQGDTPFSVALDFGNKDAIEMLLETKQWAIDSDVQGYSPIQLAAWGEDFQTNEDPLVRRREVVDFLVSRGAKLDLFAAAAIGDTDAAAAILKENPASAKALFARGRTALHAAAGRGNLEIAKLLIQNGADVNAHDQGPQFTPLHLACMPVSNFSFNRAASVVKYLVTQGADVNAGDVQGHTAFWIAQRTHFSWAIGFLKSKNAVLDGPKPAPEKPPAPPKGDF